MLKQKEKKHHIPIIFNSLKKYSFNGKKKVIFFKLKKRGVWEVVSGQESVKGLKSYKVSNPEAWYFWAMFSWRTIVDTLNSFYLSFAWE